MGQANLTWTDPTENTDNSELSDLVGYNVYYSQDADNLNSVIYVAEEGNPTSSLTIDDLEPGVWYFGITAINALGIESELSVIGNKTIYPQGINMEIIQLKTLIDSDVANAAKTDEEVLTWCNTPTIAQEHRSLSGSEILEVTDGTEFASKTAGQQNVWLGICAVTQVSVANGSVLAKVTQDTFGASTTLNNLKALREFTNSPAADAGLGKIRLGHIEKARAI